MPLSYRDRREAGRVLARLLEKYRGRDDVIVLALPRGGVPVAYEVARHLRAPLDVFVVRKLGVPGQEELAMGAIASGGVRFLNQDVLRHVGISPGIIDGVARRETEEIARRERQYRGNRPYPNLSGRVVILVDDGLATGSTMRAAVSAVRQRSPKKVVVAAPVAAAATCEEFESIADEIVCARTPEVFHAVSSWYDDFRQTADEEVRELLDAAERERAGVGDR